jgi:FkbM family methyltransferase
LFEPLQQVYNKLKENFKSRKNVVAYNLGLGENNEEMTINSNEYSPSSSLLEMLDLHKTISILQLKHSQFKSRSAAR